MASGDFLLQMQGYGLTTANILYRLPDHPRILQTYIWQEYDLHPHFPELRKFRDCPGSGTKNFLDVRRDGVSQALDDSGFESARSRRP